LHLSKKVVALAFLRPTVFLYHIISRRFMVAITNNLSDDTTAYSPLHIRHCHLRPRLEREKEGGVSTFLCIMRSAEYDLGRCSHQSDDDILFKQYSWLPL
jgi:hypothetical protein